MPNYAFTRGLSLPTATNGQTFEGYNFMQVAPNTDIFVGVTGLTFRKCNLINCKVPGDAVIEDSINIQKSLCANLHPEWVAKGVPAEVENCAHVTDTDEIWIDGVLVDTIYHYEDTTVPPTAMILPKMFFASMLFPVLFIIGKIITDNPVITRRNIFNPFSWGKK